jgi:hypothetical protein
MTLRCDHCRGRLDRIAKRYWHMRFCSETCKKAYQGRLDESTRNKIALIDRLARGAAQTNGRRFGSHSLAGFGSRFAA